MKIQDQNAMADMSRKPAQTLTNGAKQADVTKEILMNTPNAASLEVYRKRYIVETFLGRRYTTFLKITPTDKEMRSIWRGRLLSCQIQTSEGLNISQAFNFQLNRVRNRWNVAIKRSTGFVLFDSILRGLLGLFAVIGAIMRFFVGTRVRFSDLLEGSEFQSRTIEQQRETETMIFASLAAVMKAADFAGEGSAEITYLSDGYMTEVKGLTFAGGMVGTMGADENSDDEDDDDLFGEEDDEFDELDIMEME